MINGPYKRAYRPESVFGPGKRRRLNLLAISTNVFLPWIVFCVIFYLMSFNVHYMRPGLANASVFVGITMSLVGVFFAYRAKARDDDPMWFFFSSLSIFLASVLAGVFG